MRTTPSRPTRRAFAARASVLFAALTAGALLAAPAGAATRPVGGQLAEVRAATARYHDVDAAVTAGYLPSDHCVEDDRGAAMGFHYVDPDLLFDGVVDPTRPEILLYAPTAGGGLRLVGVEYVSFVPGEQLFGQPFHGDGAQTLHAWIWQANPEGTFTDFNRNLSC